MGVFMVLNGFMTEGVLAVGFLILLLLKGLIRWSSFVRVYSFFLFFLSLCVLCLSFNSVGSLNQFGTLFVMDPVAYFAKACILFLACALLLFLEGYIVRYQLPETETYFLLGTQVLGMLLSVSCCHWISLFVCLELMYLPMYALVAIKAQDKVAQESACKYIILSAFSTGILLYGIGFLYASVGSFSFHDMFVFVSAIQNSVVHNTWMTLTESQLLFSTGGLLVTVSLCFKLGVVPFHFWVRDVYEGSLYFVTALISSLPKLVLIVIWMRIFSEHTVSVIYLWSVAVFVMGMLSLFFGNLLALSQERVRSLFAYASFANMGFVLLALGMVNSMGSQAAIVYTFGYLCTVMFMFLLFGSITVKGRHLVLLDDLKGLAFMHPRLALFLSLAIFSLLGIPPFAGFMFKVNLVMSLINSDYIVFAVLVVLATVLSAYYYINLINFMCFCVADDDDSIEVNVSMLQRWTFNFFAFALLFFGLYPQGLFALVNGFFS